ncbi:hypothetical protein VTH06DRAFT_7142 [Thermothelomyces fergusii]
MSRVMQMPPPPPLLLTKRVTSFLRANLSPIIHSAMLTTPAGSLLAHASDLPASALRRQAAVAASLWALQSPSNQRPGCSADPATASIPPGSTIRVRKGGHHSSTITVQLDNGAVFVIRRLRCGMLFICMGGVDGAAPPGELGSTDSASAPHSNLLGRSPAAVAPPAAIEGHQPPQGQPPDTMTTAATDPSLTSRPSTPPPSQLPPAPAPLLPSQQPQQQQPSAAATTPAAATATGPQPPTLTTPSNNGHPPAAGTAPGAASQSSATPTATPHAGSPSQVSFMSSTSTTVLHGGSSGSSSSNTGRSGSASLMRRHVEELARWLDERLGGLCVPEEGIGAATAGVVGA